MSTNSSVANWQKIILNCWGILAITLVMNACAPHQSQQVVHYPDGGRRWVVDLVDGRPHGDSTRWHPNGVVAGVGHYNLGKQHGHFISYDSNGNQTKQEIYESGRLVWTGGPETIVPSHLRHSVSLSSTQSVATGRDNEPLGFSTLESDPMNSTLRTQLGGHLRDRTSLSSHAAAVYREKGWIALGNITRSSVDDNQGPSGSKLSAAIGAGYSLYDSKGYSVAITSKLSFALLGDDIAGFAAASRTTYGHLAESPMGEPNSGGIQLMGHLRRIKGQRTIRLDFGLTPTFRLNESTPQPSNDFRLFAYVGAGLGLASDGYSFSLELVGSSKIVGALEEIPFSISTAAGIHFDTVFLEPSVTLSTPVDLSAGEVLVFLVGLRHSLGGRDND